MVCVRCSVVSLKNSRSSILLWLPVFYSATTARRVVLDSGPHGHFRSGTFYSILVFAMTKRKPSQFSVTKAVKANARERVGQPKPARVVDTEPRTGREAKHKPKLEQIIQQEE
jgi:hypothetical protein